MAIEIVSFPIQNGDFPVRYVAVYQRVDPRISSRQFWSFQEVDKLTWNPRKGHIQYLNILGSPFSFGNSIF
jgi:hypothetical protein